MLRAGSGAPDPTSDTANAGTTPAADAPKPAAVASSDNGSDIIPPFSAGKEPATKKGSPAAAPGKAAKKTAGKKPKKKGAGA